MAQPDQSIAELLDEIEYLILMSFLRSCHSWLIMCAAHRRAGRGTEADISLTRAAIYLRTYHSHKHGRTP